MTFPTLFMGRTPQYWAELQARAEQYGLVDPVVELAVARVERDEAREIARELAEFLRHVLHTGWLRPGWDMEDKHAWRRIRHGVRRWLEE